VLTALAGGVGAAKLLAGLVQVVDPADITAIVNTGDDVVLHGLHISPDLDTVTYTLAGLDNKETGWGLAGETWTVMDALERLGGETWFRLGDQDLATHLYRTGRLGAGASLSQVTAELAAAQGVAVRLLPMSDDPVRTRLTLPAGAGDPLDPEEHEVAFQHYFVRLRHDVAVSSIAFDGAASASPAPGVLDAIGAAELVIACPSNPLVSIGPLLAVPVSPKPWSPAAPTWWPSRRSSRGPHSKGRRTACFPSSATRRRWSGWHASTPPGSGRS